MKPGTAPALARSTSTTDVNISTKDNGGQGAKTYHLQGRWFPKDCATENVVSSRGSTAGSTSRHGHLEGQGGERYSVLKEASQPPQEVMMAKISAYVQYSRLCGDLASLSTTCECIDNEVILVELE